MAEAFKPINGGGIQQRPFSTYKRWTVTHVNYREDTYSHSVLKGISPEHNERINVSESIGLPAYREIDQLDNSNSNSTSFLKSKHQKVVWSGLNQMFFKHRARVERDLYASASIFSIPHNRLGDGVQPGSVDILDTSVSSSTLDNLVLKDIKIDEQHGRLYDFNLDTGSYVPFGNLIGYWGFNDEVVSRTAGTDDLIEDRSGYLNNGSGRNIVYSPGIETTGDYQLPTGTKATFDGSTSYVLIKHNKKLDLFESTDYSISLWSILPSSQSADEYDYNWILSKAGTYRDFAEDNKGKQLMYQRNVETDIYPFDIKIANQNLLSDNGKVFASFSNGTHQTEITSSTKLNDSTAHHIVFNKTGSNLELWIDGTKEGTQPFNGAMKGIHNKYDMLIGSKFISDGFGGDSIDGYGSLSGSLDEIRIYNKALTQSEIESLSDNDYITGSAYQTSTVGEVFYKHGIIVISDPRPVYRYVLTGETGDWDYGDDPDYGWRVKYKSTKQLHEINVMCEVGSNEFNVSQNPTVKKNNDVNASLLKPFVTGSDFKPYFTTIGLYNPNGDLIAIGKLASAIQNRDDVDITINVRLDLDGAFGAPSTGSLEPVGRPTTVVETVNSKGRKIYKWGKTDIPNITT